MQPRKTCFRTTFRYYMSTCFFLFKCCLGLCEIRYKVVWTIKKTSWNRLFSITWCFQAIQKCYDRIEKKNKKQSCAIQLIFPFGIIFNAHLSDVEVDQLIDQLHNAYLNEFRFIGHFRSSQNANGWTRWNEFQNRKYRFLIPFQLFVIRLTQILIAIFQLRSIVKILLN